MGYVLRQYLTYRILVATGMAPGQAARKAPGRFFAEDQARAAGWSVPQLAEVMRDLVQLDRELKRSRLPADVQVFAWCVRAVEARGDAA